MNETFNAIRKWGDDKGLTTYDRRFQQMTKLSEEVGELAGGIAKDKPDAIKDGIGDCVVVLTLLAKQFDFTIEECVEHAYNVIKNRTGKTVDGVFVRDTTD